VGKTDEEIRAAVRARVGWFNVESEQELANITELAEKQGATARVAVRVNPDVDPVTHQYTTTGTRETKFGVGIESVRRLFADFRGRRGLDLAGLHFHLGSPVYSVEPYVLALKKVLGIADELRADGHGIRAINIGGGFGAHYQAGEALPASAYAERIVPLLRGSGLEVILEPGRSVAANAGVLLTRTIYNKAGSDRRFVIVDAGITELIRPALYGSYHFVWPVEPADGLVPEHRGADLRLEDTVLTDVVGPICESGDFLARDRWLPPVSRGELLCVFAAGAYGFTMSSQYNSRPRAAEVLVNGGLARAIRRRETYDDLVRAERS
jgi:diaminopimelate decarboxylase